MYLWALYLKLEAMGTSWGLSKEVPVVSLGCHHDADQAELCRGLGSRSILATPRLQAGAASRFTCPLAPPPTRLLAGAATLDESHSSINERLQATADVATCTDLWTSNACEGCYPYRSLVLRFRPVV